MKRLLYFLPVLLLIFGSCGKGVHVTPKTSQDSVKYPGIWTQLSPFSGSATDGSFSFTLNGKGYLVGGDQLSAMWEYDPSTDKWTQKASYPGMGMQFLSGFTINGKAYVGLGYGYDQASGSVQHTDFYAYDPSNDTWTRITDFPGGARYGSFGFALNNQGYVGAGATWNSDRVYFDMWKYDPGTNSWSQAADYPGVGYYGDVSFTANGSGYVGLGLNHSNVLTYDLWQYDPSLNKWTQKAAFTGKYQEIWPMYFMIGTDEYVGFGSNSTAFWKYNTETDQWSRVANFPGQPRIMGAAFAIGNTGYIGLGATPTVSQTFNEVWKFQPQQ
ncbi:MAG TPA: kelch repeat-containing protein [Mucilaginibacter sp.]|nr:kelch repeat-containing protein [Mucilaginibacter sp.]